ncbi:major capsid protein [Streptomyces sp. LHD-70]|uniref:major capsid protein n=1 Tax=Streptomyces sp. LHD-70 TaxID=3072140 RepID=UPI00280CE953|nr:major capsid protein [Streptomyces sp. LHD-70]MDQ8708195.1 major capsid protein [Streptomyces sp. LHD-70]
MNREQLDQLLARLTDADDAQRSETIANVLGELNTEQAAELVESGLAAYDDMTGADGERTDDDITSLTRLVDVVEAARGRQDELVAAEEQRQAQLAELHGRLRPEGDSTAGDDAEASSDNQPQAEAPVEPATTLPAAETTEPAPAPIEAAPVAASRRGGTNFGALRSDRSSARQASNWSLTASADIPGYSTGQELNFDQLIDAATRRMQGLARIGRSNAEQGGVNVAQFQLQRDQNLVARNAQDHSVLDYAADERRLPGGSLVAACATDTVAQGDVWCSPSDQLWEFCPDLASRDGILDLPTITVRHGGLRWPSTPDFATVYAKLAEHTWDWTDEEVCDPAKRPETKPCAELPCPDWNEVRLRPRGMCIKADILRNYSWPEQVRDWVQRLMTAHVHKINADTIASMARLADTTVEFAATGTEPDTTATYGPGATAGLLGALELHIEEIRYRSRMARSTTVEVVLPYWITGLLRSDLAKRTGVDLISVPDSRINSWFAERGARVQYVYDWQDLTPADPATLKGWPTTLSVLMYTAGAYISARQDIVSLDSIYDSTLLLGDTGKPGNKFLSLFTEEAHMLGKRCGTTRLLKIDLCANGYTSGALVPEAPALACPAA